MWKVVGAFPAPDWYSRDHKGYAGIGPLPCRLWAKHPDDPKHKLSYKFKPSRYCTDIDKPHRHYAEAIAIKYAEWLAERDGIRLYGKDVAVWWDNKRIRAVNFNNVTIDIPNWDFQHPPIEQCGPFEDGATC